MPGEFELGSQERGIRIDEGGPVAFQQFRRRQLSAPLRQLGFIIEQLKVARRTGHEEVNHPLGPRRLRGPLGREGIRRRRRCRPLRRAAQQCVQGQRTHAHAALLEKPAAREVTTKILRRMLEMIQTIHRMARRNTTGTGFPAHAFRRSGGRFSGMPRSDFMMFQGEPSAAG